MSIIEGMENSKASTDLDIHTGESLKADIAQPVTGIKFVFLLMSLTCASLLVFLDTSVISTVCTTFFGACQ